MRPVPICLVLATVLALPTAALAGKDKGKKKNHDQGVVETTFSYGQRESVRVYFVDKHGRGNCPPRPGEERRRLSASGPGQEAIRSGANTTARRRGDRDSRRRFPSASGLRPPATDTAWSMGTSLSSPWGRGFIVDGMTDWSTSKQRRRIHASKGLHGARPGGGAGRRLSDRNAVQAPTTSRARHPPRTGGLLGCSSLRR